MKAPQLRSVAAGTLIFAILGAQVAVDGAGFGLRKRKISLQVRRPAAVRLANTTVAFVGSATNKEYQSVLGSLEQSLEAELVGNERTLVRRPTPADAAWLIKLVVTGYSAPVSKQRTESSRNTVTSVRWTGALQVAYQVTDPRGRAHDAGNVESRFDRDFNALTTSSVGKVLPSFLGGSKGESTAAPSNAEDVKQAMVKDVVGQIATQLGNTSQALEVQVAGGEPFLERSGDFFENRLWSRGLEELEKAAPLPKADDEAYRQYNMGLAYEAISYEAKTYAEQRAALFKAQEYYDKATELNTKERYFVESVARAKEAVALYKALDAFQRDDRGAAQTAAKPPAARTPEAEAAVAPAAVPAATTKPLTLADVIEMHEVGVPPQSIVESVRQAPAAYDLLLKDSQIQIAKAKLPPAVVNEMRRKTGLPPLGGARSTRPAAPAGPTTAVARPGDASGPTTAVSTAPATTAKPAPPTTTGSTAKPAPAAPKK